MTVTLAIVTSTPQVAVALANEDGLMATFALRAGRRHGETLAPAIRSITGLAGIELRDVERIAVDTGPGLFTGLRVGVSTAKALGSALDRPIVGVSSLDILAHPLRLLGRPVASVVDARRGEVFWALYEPVADAMVAVREPTVAAPDELAGLGPDVLLTGDGARRYADMWSSPVAPPEFDHPSASVLAGLSFDRPAWSPEKVTPTYLRGADVRIGWEQR
ncbi:MAG TPA: tRNA (adenosine(37)-N6)-threonylcarbamoyltransferase complex dimerization subunit type 1 TsaB [Acidimicrobiales bacterium]|nr:tRNA (adenosine(37)-N6)-threonylcarbamoyltransferase complex dimerization subunit type 1 TsaB [Acidimicrobiales bacterium]